MRTGHKKAERAKRIDENCIEIKTEIIDSYGLNLLHAQLFLGFTFTYESKVAVKMRLQSITVLKVYNVFTAYAHCVGIDLGTRDGSF